MELARNKGDHPIQVSEISKAQNIPVKYLEQLIRTLKKADLVTSVRGSKGGHRLNTKPDQITVGTVVRLFEGQSDLVMCVSSPNQCARSQDCRVREVWVSATRAMYAELDKITIADLICEPGAI